MLKREGGAAFYKTLPTTAELSGSSPSYLYLYLGAELALRETGNRHF